MPLASGFQLGLYEIVSLLGSGGMGEVYRAHDTRLGRQVAVKVLPEIFAADPERIARLEREAKVLASLNHPHIAALYGLDQSGDRHFLVMELVEGETLADRIRRGPLPVEEALKLALGIADALEAAHEKAIVHRDLKPANVKIAPDGKVKVLDFGLAKAGADGQAAGSAANLSLSPTLSMMATQAGVILGTAAYMSPEQAQGLPVDHRSDVFSFGSVVFEMLTGRQAFQGDTAAALLAAVLIKEPDFAALPSNLNPRVVDLVRRCLDKNAKRRWQAVGDLRVELEAVAAAPRALPASEDAAPSWLSWKRALLVTAAAAILSGAIGLIAGRSLQPSAPPAPVTRFPITLSGGAQAQLTPRRVPVLAISPDGTQVAYSTFEHLYVRSMSTLDARAITTVGEGVFHIKPVFSPDSQSLVFWSTAAAGQESALKKVSVTGGPVTTLTPISSLFGMSWGDDGILVGQGSGGIVRVSPNGGTPEQLVKVTDGQFAHAPQMLPGGQAILFTLSAGATLEQWDKSRVVVQSLSTGERKTVIENGSDARYVPSGHLVYAVGGVLYGVAFDVTQLATVGGAVPLVEGVARSTGLTVLGPVVQFSLSNTGSLVYIPGTTTSTAQLGLAMFDRNGSVEPLKVPPGSYGTPRISPDGRRVAFGIDDGENANVWVYDLSGASSMRRLTFGGKNWLPVWSADGERIAYQSDREKDLAIFWQRADGTGTPERLTTPEAGAAHAPESWSPKGDTLLYTVTRDSAVTLWTLSLTDRKAAPFADVKSRYTLGAVFSRDGRWVAYSVRDAERTRSTIYVQPFPATGAKYQISKDDDGHHPVWSPDGKELFYVPGAGLFAVVSVTTQPSLTFGNPVPLPRRFNENGPSTPSSIDITPDGKRFVGVVIGGGPGQAQNSSTPADVVQVVLNWAEELKQTVPVP